MPNRLKMASFPNRSQGSSFCPGLLSYNTHLHPEGGWVREKAIPSLALVQRSQQIRRARPYLFRRNMPRVIAASMGTLTMLSAKSNYHSRKLPEVVNYNSVKRWNWPIALYLNYSSQRYLKLIYAFENQLFNLEEIDQIHIAAKDTKYATYLIAFLFSVFNEIQVSKRRTKTNNLKDFLQRQNEDDEMSDAETLLDPAESQCRPSHIARFLISVHVVQIILTSFSFTYLYRSLYLSQLNIFTLTIDTFCSHKKGYK